MCASRWHFQAFYYVNRCMSQQRPTPACVLLILLLSLWSSAAESIVNTLTHLSISPPHAQTCRHTVSLLTRRLCKHQQESILLFNITAVAVRWGGSAAPVVPSCITLVSWQDMVYLLSTRHSSISQTVRKHHRMQVHHFSLGSCRRGFALRAQFTTKVHFLLPAELFIHLDCFGLSFGDISHRDVYPFSNIMILHPYWEKQHRPAPKHNICCWPVSIDQHQNRTYAGLCCFFPQGWHSTFSLWDSKHLFPGIMTRLIIVIHRNSFEHVGAIFFPYLRDHRQANYASKDS